VGPRAAVDDCGKSRPTGIRSPDCPARNESLHRLCSPGALAVYKVIFFLSFERRVKYRISTPYMLLFTFLSASVLVAKG
jgi:hypothetical protein